MNNTIMSSKNTFEGGLLMDFAPDNMSSNVMTSALNATLLTFNGNEMLLQNDMGNGRVETARLPDGYIPVGSCEFGDIIYIVSYNPILNKSLIGCFPSPERNISSEEIGDMKLTLSTDDFQEIIEEKATGKLKNSSVKKILYNSKDMASGDKYIIYSSELRNNSQYLTDFGNTSHEYGKFPKLFKIHVVSIEESGKIVYLDSTTKWYDKTSLKNERLDYFINLEGKKDGESQTLDIDSYRTLVSSAYSIFSSKVSGKLALLIELEKITGFSCSWEPYVKSYECDSQYPSLQYVNYDIYWNFSWTTNDNNINPNGALLLESEWKTISDAGHPYIWDYTAENGFLPIKIDLVEYPKVVTTEGPNMIITRKYEPENFTADFKTFLNEYEYNSYLSKVFKEINDVDKTNITPYKVMINRDLDNGHPVPGEYYVNCNRTYYNYSGKLEKQKEESHKNTIDTTSVYYNKIDDKELYYVLANYKQQLGTQFGIYNVFTESSIPEIPQASRISYDLVAISENKFLVTAENTIYYIKDGVITDLYIDTIYKFIVKKNEFEYYLVSSDDKIYEGTFINELFTFLDYKYDLNIKDILDIEYYKNNDSLVTILQNKNVYELYEYKFGKKSLLGKVDIEYNNPRINIVNDKLYIIYSQESLHKYEYNLNFRFNAYSVDDKGKEVEINKKQLTDDIINNYFHYPVIKPFTVINKFGEITPFTFRIPNKQSFIFTESNLGKVNLLPNIKNLIYHYKIAPTMPYGYLEEYTQEGYIDFSKIGKKDIKLHTWKYYNQSNVSTLTWGMDAYVESGKGISEIVFEFYDNKGFAAAYHTKDKNSYNGTFTDYILLNNSGSNYKLNDIDHLGLKKYHKGIQVISDNIDLNKIYLNLQNQVISLFSNNEIIYENDCGILYSNCLYLVKIIVKYCNKDILGNYVESDSEYVYDYRWFWTNNMFNNNYYNTKDFNELQFKLGLTCAQEVSVNSNYFAGKYLYTTSGSLTENSTIEDTLSANIQAISLNNNNRDNIDLSMTVGLINDYGSFNLNSNKLNDFRASVYLGDEYASNNAQEPKIIYTEKLESGVLDRLLPRILTIENIEVKPDETDYVECPKIIVEDGKLFLDHPDFDNVTLEVAYISLNTTSDWKSYTVPVIILDGVEKILARAKKNEVYSTISEYILSKKIVSRIVNPSYFEKAEDGQLIEGAGSSNTQTFNLNPPQFNVGSCEVYGSLNISLSHTISGVKIIYNCGTKNVAVPSVYNNIGTLYTEPFTLEPENDTDTTYIVKAIAYKEGKGESKVLTNTYTIKVKKEELLNSGNINRILGTKVSETLYNILGLTPPDEVKNNKDLWSENYTSYINNFIIEGPSTIPDWATEFNNVDDNILYKTSTNEIKTLTGYKKYEMPLEKILKSRGGKFNLTLQGIHYSKYAYTVVLKDYIPTLRSFVLDDADLQNYNINLYLSENTYTPYCNHALGIASADTGGDDTCSYWTWRHFSKSKDDEYDCANTGYYKFNDWNEERSVPISELLSIGDMPYNEMPFMFPVHYVYDSKNAGQFWLNSSVVITTNKKYKIAQTSSSDKPNYKISTDDAYLAGTIAIKKGELIEIANNHVSDIENSDGTITNKSNEDDILERCAKIATVYLTQLFYLDDELSSGCVPSNYNYLEPNTYSYKRDIIVRINTTSLNHNDLISINGISFSTLKNGTKEIDGYVDTVLNNIDTGKVSKETLKNLPNVNLILEDVILTIPIEYNAEYIAPETGLGVSNEVKVKSILYNGPQTVNQHVEKNKIYGYNGSTFNVLGNISKLKYIEKITKDDNNKLQIELSGNEFGLGTVNSGVALGIDSNKKLIFRSIPLYNGTYSVGFCNGSDLSNDGDDNVIGFKNFKVYVDQIN